jgi:hypothetical protein
MRRLQRVRAAAHVVVHARVPRGRGAHLQRRARQARARHALGYAAYIICSARLPAADARAGAWVLTTEPVMEPPAKLREACATEGLAPGVFDICALGETRVFGVGDEP